VRSNKVARKRLTESNGTPAMDFGWRMGFSTEASQKKKASRQSDKSSMDFVLFRTGLNLYTDQNFRDFSVVKVFF